MKFKFRSGLIVEADYQVVKGDGLVYRSLVKLENVQRVYTLEKKRLGVVQIDLKPTQVKEAKKNILGHTFVVLQGGRRDLVLLGAYP